MKEGRVYFLLNEANEIVEGFINATDAWRALCQADGTRSLIAKPLPMRLDDMSELVAKLDPVSQFSTNTNGEQSVTKENNVTP